VDIAKRQTSAGAIMASEWDVVSHTNEPDDWKVKEPTTFEKIKAAAKSKEMATLLKSFSPVHQLVGAAENALPFVTGLVSTPVSGLAGMVSGALAPEGEGLNKAADTVRSVQNALTYEPRTDVGKLQQKYSPLQLPGMAAEYVGSKTLESTNSPALATIGNVATQALPALLFRRAGGATTVASDTAALDRAKVFAEQKAGLDWSKLSDAFRDKLTSVAARASDLNNLDPAAIARQAKLDALQIPATRGQLTRSLPQLTTEDNLIRTEAGAPVRNIYAQQDKRLHELLANFRSPEAPATAIGVGEKVQGAARAAETQSKTNYDKLYKIAEETEPNATVSANPLFEMLKQNPEMQHIGFVKTWLDKAKMSEGSQIGNRDLLTNISTAQKVGNDQVTLRGLQDLRVTANGISKIPSTDSYYAGQVVRAIDAAMQGVPDSAKAWKAANNAFKEHKITFDDQRGVERLVSNATRTDPKVALEDTFDKSVRSGTADQLTQVKTLLNKSGDSGVQAWTALQSAAIDYLREKAAGKRAVVGEQGQLQFNGSFLDALHELDADGKLDVLFDPAAAKQIREIADVTRDIRTKPATRVEGSSSASNIMRIMENVVSKTPIVGDVLGGTIKAAQKLHQMGQESRLVNEATRSPLEDAAQARVASQKAIQVAMQLKKLGYPAALVNSANERARKLSEQLQQMN
jgi:hypothetical protein